MSQRMSRRSVLIVLFNFRWSYVEIDEILWNFNYRQTFYIFRFWQKNIDKHKYLKQFTLQLLKNLFGQEKYKKSSDPICHQSSTYYWHEQNSMIHGKSFFFQQKMFLFVSFNCKRNKIYLGTCSDNLSHLCIQSHLLFSVWWITYCKCKTVSTLHYILFNLNSQCYLAHSKMKIREVRTVDQRLRFKGS